MNMKGCILNQASVDNMMRIRIPLKTRGERERLFGSREREITFPFYGKGTGIRKCYGKGMGNLRLVIPGIQGIPGNHIKSKVNFKI